MNNHYNHSPVPLPVTSEVRTQGLHTRHILLFKSAESIQSVVSDDPLAKVRVKGTQPRLSLVSTFSVE